MKATPTMQAGRFLLYFILIVAALTVLTPLFWLIASTTKNETDLFHYTFFAPRFSVQGYRETFS